MLALLTRTLFVAGLLASLVPAWVLAGKVIRSRSRPGLRLMVCLGLDLVAFLTVVNLLGRWLERSVPPLLVFASGAIVSAVWLWRRRPEAIGGLDLRAALARHRWVLAVAVVLAVPQVFLALSTSLWDEAVSSSIHLTSVNQIAEDVFPPRHNALPDIPIKYHYASSAASPAPLTI